MPLPKDITFVTFDVYGTLIDWEDGAYKAFQKEADRDGFTINKDELIPLFHEIQREIMGGSYELYAEVMRRTAVQISKRLGWSLEPSRAQFLPDSIVRWAPFKETNPALKKVKSKHEIGLISNIDDKLLGHTRRHFGPVDFDLVVTAQQVRSYKPDPAHFKECERRIGTKKGWVHVASSYYHDVEPCLKAKVPVIWVNRHGEELEPGAKKPTEEVSDLKSALKLLGLLDLRVVALHEDVVVVTSQAWQTSCTLIRHGEEAFCLDSPVFPQELETLPVVAEQAGFRVVGLLATHADWDHVLGRLAFPDAPLGCAASTAERLRSEPGEAQRRLRDFDEEHYVERPAPLTLPAAQGLPVPGHCAVGEKELELHRAEGHTGDGMAVLVPWARVLCVGDYLSPWEIPMLSPGGSRDFYLETLDRLEPVIERADHVVAGHGGAIDAERALAILREDRAYLEGLPGSRLPIARRSAAQKKIHAANLERI